MELAPNVHDHFECSRLCFPGEMPPPVVIIRRIAAGFATILLQPRLSEVVFSFSFFVDKKRKLFLKHIVLRGVTLEMYPFVPPVRLSAFPELNPDFIGK